MKCVKRICPGCNLEKSFRLDCKTCGCKQKPKLSEQSKAQLELQKLRDKKEGKESEIVFLRNEVLRLEQENSALSNLSVKTPQLIDIPSKIQGPQSESAAVMVWSDFHIEEEVLPGAVANKNEYNLEIAEQRFINLLHGGLSWFNIAAQKTQIDTLVIAALGDFISGSIHEDLAESNLLPPVEAIYKSQGLLISGIQFFLDNTTANIKVVCHGGNHGRMTKKQRIATEVGNSLEQYMFYSIRDHFKNEKRLEFVIATGYHTYVRFFEGRYEIRFHHGHQINYQGGVGGITIPVNKAIAQWNRARSVDLDVFGHFHTRFDGGSFIANGSLIGYNPYAVSIKAGFEKPSQTFFLINKEYSAKTLVAPVFVE